MRFVLAILLAVSTALAWAGPALAEAPEAQAPNVRPFQSAHFGLAGTVKVDGITVDILGEGDLSMPDRHRASYKFGPFTVELVLADGNLYTRSRFERQWDRQPLPAGVDLGPLSSSEQLRFQRNSRLVGSEVVDGVVAEHYASQLDLGPFVERVLAEAPDGEARRQAREVLRTFEGSIDTWVGAQDRLIRQERFLLSVTLPAFEPEGDPVPAAVDMTIAYSRLNVPVTIAAPTRNDPSPIRTPQPGITPVSGPPGSPARAPAQLPRR